ncbi:hypothetical protein [Longimicrobium sp.]|uniref:hypothetical protein n=1 Tax=Longimicrobium sp. TaxID=2029185 RepID=UPI003B3B7F1C
MAFTLRVTFVGLCLFAADEARRRMHVLMPRAVGQPHGPGHHDGDHPEGESGANHAHCVDPHIPVLEFDTAHLRAGQQEPDELVARRTLRGTMFTLGGGAEPDLRICPQIVGVRDVAGSGVLPEFLEDVPGNRVASRVTLESGRMSAVAKGECWEWADGQCRRMAHEAEWELPMEGDSLSIELRGVTGGVAEGKPIVTLYPIESGSGRRVLNLMVRHLPLVELGPDDSGVPVPQRPAHGTEATHFSVYYELFGTEPRVLPKYCGTDCADLEGDCPLIEGRGGLAYNCMLGGG